MIGMEVTQIVTLEMPVKKVLTCSSQLLGELEYCPVYQKVLGSIPIQGTYPR